MYLIISGGVTLWGAKANACPGRNTSALAAALAVNIGNNKIVY